jgi:hypothetical protein
VIPEDTFSALRGMPNHVEPDDPQPATNAEPRTSVNGDADPISFRSAGSNVLKAMTEADLSAEARRYIGDLDGQMQAATERSGLPFGRIAIELTARFKARPRKRGSETQKAYLVRMLGRNIATIHRWKSAALIADDAEVPWSDVVRWAEGSWFTTVTVGAERIRAMRKALDAQQRQTESN